MYCVCWHYSHFWRRGQLSDSVHACVPACLPPCLPSCMRAWEWKPKRNEHVCLFVQSGLAGLHKGLHLDLTFMCVCVFMHLDVVPFHSSGCSIKVFELQLLMTYREIASSNCLVSPLKTSTGRFCDKTCPCTCFGVLSCPKPYP